MSSAGQLLVGCSGNHQLHVYNPDGQHVAAINLNSKQKLREATWTPHGRIVYTTTKGRKVVTISADGKLIVKYPMTNAQRFTVSPDGIIYLADDIAGVYQSVDDGRTWSRVFKPRDGWGCFQAMKVSSDQHLDTFWTLELNNRDYRLCACTVDKRLPAGNLKWHPIKVPSHTDLWMMTRLAMDCNKNIFLTNFIAKSVLVWLADASGQYTYYSSLIMSQHFREASLDRSAEQARMIGITSLAISGNNKSNQIVYIGHSDLSGLQVFSLQYE